MVHSGDIFEKATARDMRGSWFATLVLRNDVKPLGHSIRACPLLNRETIQILNIISMTNDDNIADAYESSTYL